MVIPFVLDPITKSRQAKDFTTEVEISANEANIEELRRLSMPTLLEHKTSISNPKAQMPKKSNTSLGFDNEARGRRGSEYKGWREESSEGLAERFLKTLEEFLPKLGVYLVS